MTRGEAQTAIVPRVYQFRDGGTILSDQPVREAQHVLAEAESARVVDEYRRRFDQAVEDHCMRFGFGIDGSRL